MAKLFEIPTTIDVYVPKLDATVAVAIPDDLGDDVVLHILQHGLKQKLVDSTAGVNSSDYATKEAYTAKLNDVVKARLATVLTIPAERAFGPRNPVETESRRLVADFLKRAGLVKKAADASEQTSSIAKAREAFGLAVRKMAAAKNPDATSEQLGDVVLRNWNKLIQEPAERIVAERQTGGVDVEV